MTISQNRFGGNSAVGRAYPSDRGNRSELAGVGIAGAGYGALRHSNTVYGRQQQKSAYLGAQQQLMDAQRGGLKRAYDARLKATGANEKFANWLRNADSPNAKRFQVNLNQERIVLNPANRLARPAVGRKISDLAQEAERRQKSAGDLVRQRAKEMRGVKREISSLGRQAKMLRRGGLAGLGLGAATVGGSIYANERSRGTLRYQRQANGV